MPLIWTKERNFADYKDQDNNEYSDQSLKKRFSLIIVTTDSLNLDDDIKLQKELTPNKEGIYWYLQVLIQRLDTSRKLKVKKITTY